MKITDLRISNYVMYNDDIVKIDSIDSDGSILASGNINGYKDCGFDGNIESLKPITLTEEILLRLGFVHRGETKEENKLYTFYGKESKFTVQKIISFFLYDNHCFGTEIKYLHKLQNLIYELIGEQLTLNL